MENPLNVLLESDYGGKEYFTYTYTKPSSTRHLPVAILRTTQDNTVQETRMYVHTPRKIERAITVFGRFKVTRSLNCRMISFY
jgi:hypothetical protein